MSFVDELGGLYTEMPNPLSVTYKVSSYASSGGGKSLDAGQTVDYARLRKRTHKEMVAHQFRGDSVVAVWDFWREVLEKLATPIVPKRGDTITYNSVKWIVRHVDSNLADRVVYCICEQIR